MFGLLLLGPTEVNWSHLESAMLDTFIIDELRRREKARERAEADRRPRLELPLHSDHEHEIDSDRDESGDDIDDPVVVITL
mgnify:CR=1 FL=1